VVKRIRPIRCKYLVDNHHHSSRKETMKYGTTKPIRTLSPGKHVGPLKGGTSGPSIRGLLTQVIGQDSPSQEP
jgi:hypothetical protein